MAFELGPRRGIYIDISEETGTAETLSEGELAHLERFDLVYRSLCALLYNYVPTSGHPGGSISSGRFVASVLYDSMDLDLSSPDREDADLCSYAAGHKALGLYAMWALRNEVARIAAPELLPSDEKMQLRLEDLLGFRRNPISKTPLFAKFHSKALDGHPTPATPHLRLSTGASGVGIATSLGLAFGAADRFGKAAPRVHIVEGEGGMTPGRVAEAFAAAGTSSLGNAIVHIDWNQASIDSNRVCRDGENPGDYVQWTPAEFARLHDWNVIFVPDGKNFQQIVAAQRRALAIDNGQPTAIVYRTIKGWQYGIEGRLSHGAGHKLCSEGFYKALAPLIGGIGAILPKCEGGEQRCKGGKIKEIYEECFWEALCVIRSALENEKETTSWLASRLVASKSRLDRLARKPRDGAPDIDKLYMAAKESAAKTPAELELSAGDSTTLRGELGRVLNYYNRKSKGAIFGAAADLLGSTSVSEVAKGFPEGFFNAKTNPGARLLSLGGICEDAISGILAGISTFGHNIGVGSSYGAFIAPLGHIAARLHAIGSQSRQALKKEPYKPFILVCGHAGLKTGEDGPTHADPQALQLLQENFPRGTAITLTPWEPQEVWPLVTAALERRPAFIAPFVTRPNERVPDREKLGFPPASECTKGIVRLRKARGKGEGTVVIQESGVMYAFVEEAMQLLEKEGVDLNVYCVTSAELFDMLPASEQQQIFPDELSREAMGITGFTLPTMFRWIDSEFGRRMTMHPFQKGHYLGSGQADMVLAEAGLDGESQFRQIMKYVKEKKG
ncbi:MAG TPA: hypothetical protein PLZ86_06405 [bacterium]|nr:hypothetical protein [bacterium]